MIRHDLSQWPLVLSAARGAMSLDEQLVFFSDWNAWLDRGESFSALRVFTDAEALRRPEGGAKDAKVWLQANGERIRQFVIGMATVVPSEAIEEMGRINAEKLFGIPMQMFDDVNEAAMWLASLSAAQGRPLDVGGALRGLAALRRLS